MNRRAVFGGVAAGLIALGVAGAAYAQTSAPKPSGQQQADQLLDSVAAKLGKSHDELRAAVIAAQKEQVAKAVQEGRLTQEQATGLNQRIDQRGGRIAGVPLPKAAKGANNGKGANGAGIKGPTVQVVTDQLAASLGLQPRELAQELRSGKSLAEVAQAKGKSRDDLKAQITSLGKTRVDAAVASGRITREQGDAAMKALGDSLDKAIDRKATPKNNAPKRGARA